MLTLGSLFDGSGGFPLAGMRHGFLPVWASEVDPFAIRVTTKRIPRMRHFGDIRKLDGGKLQPVDVITFGSPCQDLSVAGRQEGLGGSRSGLFFAAVRIIMEMRRATNGQKPRFCVWENVPGAFISNGGGDFKAVLNSLVGIVEEDATVPPPEKGGWAYADVIVGDGWSIAWRTLDAKYFGVPQRRRRIFLVCDFGGERAAEILFEPKGVPGNFEKGRFEKVEENRQAPARGFDSGFEKTSRICLNDQGGNRMSVSENVTCTLRSQMSSSHPPLVFDNHPMDSRISGPLEVSPTVCERWGTGGNNAPAVLCFRDSHFDVGENVAPSMMRRDCKTALVVGNESFVRRMTPLECGRLQGFPDNWLSDLGTPYPTEEELDFWDGVFEEYRRVVTKAKTRKTRGVIAKWLKDPYNDSAAYRLWGNGVALPCVEFVMEGIRCLVVVEKIREDLNDV